MLGKWLCAGLVSALCTALGCASSADDGGPPPGTAPTTEVLDACLEFASRLCADAAPCCTASYEAFDQEGCVAAFRREVCRPGADAVAAGRASFDADAVEPCLEAHARAHQVCIPSWAETLQLRKLIYRSCRVINGTADEGRGCTTSVTCKRPEGAGTALCVKGVCRAVEVLAEGASCVFPSGDVSVCDEGLTCDARGLGETGACVKARSSGATCDASVLEGTECGLGSYCDVTSGTCEFAANFGGKGCQQGTECVSFVCDRAADECAPAPAVVSLATCTGA